MHLATYLSVASPPMREVLLVGVGGGVGSVARYLVARFVGTGGTLPWHTIGVNVAGSLVAGFLIGLFWGRIGDAVRLGLVVGFLGGFTTFSSFSIETVLMFRDGPAGLAVLNVLGSVGAGVVAAFAGLVAGEAVGG
jgi:CrcB protein